jgi:hypothetical protein
MTDPGVADHSDSDREFALGPATQRRRLGVPELLYSEHPDVPDPVRQKLWVRPPLCVRRTVGTAREQPRTRARERANVRLWGVSNARHGH